METKAVRVFYRKSDNQIVWTHTLMGTGEFPITVEQALVKIPNKMPDGEIPLGGVSKDYACIEENDPQRAVDFLASDTNEIVNGELVIGEPRPPQLPQPPWSAHIATIVEIDVAKQRPVTISRTWEGNDYLIECYVTESLKDQYLQGNVAVGDFVRVECFEEYPGEYLVTAKVFKSW